MPAWGLSLLAFLLESNFKLYRGYGLHKKEIHYESIHGH